MSEPDAARTLTEWMTAWENGYNPDGEETYNSMQRARDEIVALRAALYGTQHFRDMLVTARAEALEEAAQFLERNGAAPFTHDIRALKDKP